MGFFGLLIPPQYRLAIEIGILVIYTGTTIHLTAKYVNNAWEAEQAHQIKEASILKSKMETEASNLKDALFNATQQHEADKNEAVKKITDLEHDLRDRIATNGLRDPGRLQRRSCQTATPAVSGVPAQSADTGGEEEHPELSRELSDFLLRQFTSAQTVVVDREQCRDDFTSVIDQVNAYADKIENIQH